MRRTLILRNVHKAAEKFASIDRTAGNAVHEAYAGVEEANYPPPEETKTTAERIAATPELADVYLSANTSLGKEEILIKPTKGLPTGLTDLQSHPSPKQSLLKVYDHTLAFVGEKFPPTSVYRTTVENMTKARKAIVESTNDTDAIEQQVGSGLVEEILVQAADEFRLAEDLAEHKVWESLEEEPLPDQWIGHAVKDQPEYPGQGI